MKRESFKKTVLDTMKCLEILRDVKARHREFIEDNHDLQHELNRLEDWLQEADLVGSEFSIQQCREAFGRVLLRIEEIAEDQQRLYDESPAQPKMEAVYQSTKDFEIKRDFETALAMLL